MASEVKGKKNPNNGAAYVTLNNLIDMFFRSRFNRDNLHDPAEGEDIDDSKLYRIYNKKDLKELLPLFFEFFEWAINAKNLGRIYLTKDIKLIRDSTMPHLKFANGFDEQFNPTLCKAGEWYITRGRYVWRLWIEGETFEKMRDIWMKDPEFVKKREELKPEMEERNRKCNIKK